MGKRLPRWRIVNRSPKLVLSDAGAVNVALDATVEDARLCLTILGGVVMRATVLVFIYSKSVAIWHNDWGRCRHVSVVGGYRQRHVCFLQRRQRLVKRIGGGAVGRGHG